MKRSHEALFEKSYSPNVQLRAVAAHFQRYSGSQVGTQMKQMLWLITSDDGDEPFCGYPIA